MGKTKRERKGRKYKFHINRKRLNKKETNTGTAAASVKIVKEAWEDSKSIRENLTSMGLVYDANAALKIPTAKDLLKPLVSDKTPTEGDVPCPSKAHIAEEMEANAKAPRVKSFELPSGQIKFLTYCIDKYGHNYKGMARDNKNIYQETWKQIRNKIRLFQKIPSQWNAYLASRSELEKPVQENTEGSDCSPVPPVVSDSE